MGDEQDIRMAFGRKVRALRRERGLSQEMLSQMAGLDRSWVGRVELGKKSASLTTIYKLAKALGVQPTDLLEDDI